MNPAFPDVRVIPKQAESGKRVLSVLSRKIFISLAALIASVIRCKHDKALGSELNDSSRADHADIFYAAAQI